jgi:hypothetical protein
MRTKAHLLVLLLVASLLATYRPRSAYALTLASDDASQLAYTNGWQAGDNGGTGFGPWVLAFSGNRGDLLYDPQFIDRAPLPGDTLGAPTFALTTGARASFSDTSEASRTFSSPIAVGQTFSMDVDGSALEPNAKAFSIGNTLQLFGSDGIERFGLFTNNQFNGNNWTVTGDISTGIPAGSAFHIDFTLATANTYNLALKPLGGGSPLFSQTGAPLEGTIGSAIQSINISAYGTGSSSNGSKELFFDNMTVSSAAGIPGDYNSNGSVDAADYIIWRKTRNQAGIGLPADGNGNNVVDSGDYNVWRSHFGANATGVGVVMMNVPESSSTAIFTLGATCPCLFFLRRTRNARC